MSIGMTDLPGGGDFGSGGVPAVRKQAVRPGACQITCQDGDVEVLSSRILLRRRQPPVIRRQQRKSARLIASAMAWYPASLGWMWSPES